MIEVLHRSSFVRDTEEAPLPFVSVIIPVRNEEGFIIRCLEALSHQDYSRDRFEVIVLDGESTDGTSLEVEAAGQAYGVPDVYLVNQGRTTAKGLNLGLSVASGEVIVRVDGHTMVHPTFLSASVDALRRTAADAVGGPIETLGFGPVGEAIALAQGSRFGIGDAAFRYAKNALWTDTIAFGAYKAEVFGRIGRFSEDIDHGEDDEFNYRLRESGGRILLDPAIRSVYVARSSYQALWRQYWNYGVAKAAVLARHPRRGRWRHLVPSAFITTLVLGPLVGRFFRRLRWLAPAAAVAYTTVNLASATAIASREERLDRLALIPPAFATIHIAAGAGFIAGLLRLRVRDRRR
jgi:succinoglycan biosynthesis protein ExoA